jgi:hypothetical protein
MKAVCGAFGVIYAWVLELIVPVLLPLAISAVYFFRSPQAEALSRRLLASAHGLSIAGIYLLAMTVWWTHNANQRFGGPFLIALLIPVVLIGVSFAIYRGSRATHWFQVLNVLSLGWTSFVGGMAITGDWL